MVSERKLSTDVQKAVGWVWGVQSQGQGSGLEMEVAVSTARGVKDVAWDRRIYSKGLEAERMGASWELMSRNRGSPLCLSCPEVD